MDIFIKIAQLLLSLSILVIVHELGHFLAAKLFKTRVEKFYLFFDPWFSLFKFKKGETEYGMGWLPLGGYVKIAGMVDESMDKEQLSKPPQPWEFRSKPAWQRLIIMVGGVTMNILLAIAIYIGLLAAFGEQYLPNTETHKYGIVADSMAMQMGLRTGDKIVSVNGNTVEDFNKIPAEIILENARTVEVIRDGSPYTVQVPEGFLADMIKKNPRTFIEPRVVANVAEVLAGSPADSAGLKAGDRFVAINGSPVTYYDEIRSSLKGSAGSTLQASVLRNNTDTVPLAIRVTQEGTIGFMVDMMKEFNLQSRSYNIIEAIPAGTRKTWDGVANYLKQLKLIFSPEVKAYESLGGFITIGKIFPAAWDWVSFWSLTAFLSIMLAIVNMLPIPALDGGHVMFLIYEVVSGRKPSDKFMEYAQIVGMIIVLGLVLFANGNDIVKLFR